MHSHSLHRIARQCIDQAIHSYRKYFVSLNRLILNEPDLLPWTEIGEKKERKLVIFLNSLFIGRSIFSTKGSKNRTFGKIFIENSLNFLQNKKETKVSSRHCLLTLSEASGLSGFLSGWYLSASFRYVFLISSGVAVLERPNISYNVSPDVLHTQQEKNEKL